MQQVQVQVHAPDAPERPVILTQIPAGVPQTAIALARSIWKRAGAVGRPAPADHATQQRLEQIQQAIDTIAIEVERISEGQRFVAKMMSERERSAIGAGAAEPLRNSMKSAIPSER